MYETLNNKLILIKIIYNIFNIFNKIKHLEEIFNISLRENKQ